MPLTYQPIDIPLALGVNTRDDEKLLPPVKLVDLQNAVFPKGGALKKRNGFTELGVETLATSPATISAGKLVGEREDELFMADKSKLYGYSQAGDNWADKGTFLSYGTEVHTLADSVADQTEGDVATTGGMTVAAWEDSRGGVYYAVYDAVTGAQLIAEKQLNANAIHPRCVAIDGTLHILYNDTVAGDIYTKRLTPSDLAGSDAVADIPFGYTDANAAASISVTVTGDKAVFAYLNDAANIRLGFLLQSGLVGSPASGDPIPIEVGSADRNPQCAVSANSAGDRICVLSLPTDEGGPHWEAEVYDFSLTRQGTVTSTDVEDADRVACEWNSSNTCDLFISQKPDGNAYNDTLSLANIDSTGAGATTSTVILQHSNLASHAFVHEGVVYVHAMFQSTLQSTYFVVNTAGEVLGRLFHGLANDRAAADIHLPRVSNPATDEFLWCATTKRRLSALDDSVYTQAGLHRVTYDFVSKEAYSVLERDKVQYMGGGMLWAYDGTSPVESGFLLYPENNTTSLANSTGSLVHTDTYQYRIYYSWENAQGQREQSTTAEVITIYGSGSSEGTLGVTRFNTNDDTVTFSLITLAHTYKQGDRTDLRFDIYRTEGDGTTFHLVTSLDPTASTYAENDPSTTSISFIDGMSDATLITKELDYLNTGERDNVAPPGLFALQEAQDRLWGVSFENKRRVYFSKRPKAQSAVEFNDTFYVEFPDDVAGIVEVNGQIAALTDRQVYVIPGQGPNNLGHGNYAEPESVGSEVGISDPRTLVEVPQGWAFQSSKGIWLLSKDLRTAYIGSDVDAYNDQTYTGATALDGVNQIRWLTSSGRSLLWDYEKNLWSTMTNHEGVASTNWMGTYTYLQSDGTVRTESSTWDDGGTAHALALTTTWIRPGTLQGFAKLRRWMLLGNYKGTHRLRVEVGYDFEDFYRDTVILDPSDFVESALWGDSTTWGDGVVWGGDGGSNVYQARRRPSRTRCNAFRLRITELPDASRTEGLELNALAVEVGIKTGLNKLSALRTV